MDSDNILLIIMYISFLFFGGRSLGKSNLVVDIGR